MMAPPTKTLEQYEREATMIDGCLIHPSVSARKIYQLRHGSIGDSNIAVCHTCDNPRCILDSHHWLGTWKENVADSVRKGRHSCFTNCAQPGEEFRGGKHDEATKRKIGEATKKMWADPKKKAEISENIRNSWMKNYELVVRNPK